MNKFDFLKRAVLILLFLVLFFNSSTIAQSNKQDSLRVLITKYADNEPGLEGVVTFSALMERDSAHTPLYFIQDTKVEFISEVRVDAVKSITYIAPDKIARKQRASMPNGFVKVELKPGETMQFSQVLPSSNTTGRQAFVTRLELSQFDNTSGKFSKLAKEFVGSYGTDDQVFRVFQEDARNATPILVIDSLNNKTFVESMSQIRSGTIETIDAYNAVNAMKIIGDKGVDGLFVVLIKSSFTLKEALLSPIERLQQQARELDGCNHISIISRNPIIIRE